MLQFFSNPERSISILRKHLLQYFTEAQRQKHHKNAHLSNGKLVLLYTDRSVRHCDTTQNFQTQPGCVSHDGTSLFAKIESTTPEEIAFKEITAIAVSLDRGSRRRASCN